MSEDVRFNLHIFCPNLALIVFRLISSINKLRRSQSNNLIHKMKVLLDIPDNKASSLMEVLKSISYVKAKQLTATMLF